MHSSDATIHTIPKKCPERINPEQHIPAVLQRPTQGIHLTKSGCRGAGKINPGEGEERKRERETEAEERRGRKREGWVSGG